MLDRIKKYDLEITVFICGAVVMIFELVGSRIIAPYVGTSIYAWTSLIGVILASLSAGYYYGGRFADTRPNTKPLATLIFFSGIIILVSTFVKDVISVIIVVSPFSIEIKSLIISIILFAPASFLLGIVSPYAVRLRIKNVEKAGGTSGNLYAVSTFGSIVGTFLAGYYLIPHFGSSFSLILLSSGLFVTAIFLAGREILHLFNKNVLLKIFPLIVFFFILLIGLSKNNTFVADTDTQYNRILLYNAVDKQTGRMTLNLSTDPFGTQAAIFVDNPNDLVFDYTKFFKMVEVIKPEAMSALMLGGCVYTYPRDFLSNFPKAKIDVVEIDPGMTTVAKKYFGLKDDPRMNIIYEDGRTFLNTNKDKYDVIFIDAFNSFSSIPFQLTTIESIRKNYNALKDDGIVFVNILSPIEGNGGRFFRAEYATFKIVFPKVYVFALGKQNNGAETQNIILVATKSEKSIDFLGPNVTPQLAKYSDKLWTQPIANDTPVLTDDFAPVEFYKLMSI